MAAAEEDFRAAAATASVPVVAEGAAQEVVSDTRAAVASEVTGAAVVGSTLQPKECRMRPLAPVAGVEVGIKVPADREDTVAVETEVGVATAATATAGMVIVVIVVAAVVVTAGMTATRAAPEAAAAIGMVMIAGMAVTVTTEMTVVTSANGHMMMAHMAVAAIGTAEGISNRSPQPNAIPSIYPPVLQQLLFFLSTSKGGLKVYFTFHISFVATFTHNTQPRLQQQNMLPG